MLGCLNGLFRALIGSCRAFPRTPRVYIPLGEVWFVGSTVIGRRDDIIRKVGNLPPGFDYPTFGIVVAKLTFCYQVLRAR